MKKTKIIIPALGILLLSTAASVTGTVAWFAANAQSSATGMQIKAKSNTTFLLVSHANTGDTAPASADVIQAENSGAGFKDIAFSAAAKEVLPVAPASALTPATYYQVGDEIPDGHAVGDLKTASSKTDYAAGAGISDPAYWYTMAGTDSTAAGYVGVANSEVDVTANAFDATNGYVLKYSLYFTIADGANPATNLVVDKITMTGDSAIRCLAVGSAGSAIFSASTETDSIPLIAALNSTTVSRLNLYMWYDGNHNTIYTQNAGNILEGTIGLTFKVTASTAA